MYGRRAGLRSASPGAEDLGQYGEAAFQFRRDPDRVGVGRVAVAEHRDPQRAVEGAHVVTTDVWASMGQEAEREVRLEAFQGYGVSEALMARALPGAIFLHCLPAHRGEEVTSEVIDGPTSRVFVEAENRLHVQKALLLELLA